MARHKPGNKPNDRLNQRMEEFAYEYLKHFNAGKAAQAVGYSAKTAQQIGHNKLKDPRIQKILVEFREKRKAEAVLSFNERAQILSEIARAKLSDFVRVNSPGLVEIISTDEQTNKSALKSIKQRVESEDRGGGMITDIDLRDPIQAISELNKMFGDHAPTRIDARMCGTIEAMTDEEIKAELERLDEIETNIATGKKKTSISG